MMPVIEEGRPTTRTAAGAKVLAEPHYTAPELVPLLGNGGPTRHQLARLRAHRSLLGLRLAQKGFLYPAFQVDVARERLLPDVVRANRRLLAALDVEAVLMWWFTRCDGVRPADVAHTDGPRVMALAIHHVESVVRGAGSPMLGR